MVVVSAQMWMHGDRLVGCVRCLLVEEWNRGVARRREKEKAERWLEWDLELILEEEELEELREKRFQQREEEWRRKRREEKRSEKWIPHGSWRSRRGRDGGRRCGRGRVGRRRCGRGGGGIDAAPIP